MSIIRNSCLIIILACLSGCVATSKPHNRYTQGLPIPQKTIQSDEALGRKYLLGLGVMQNNEKAFNHFKIAADSGNAFAQNEVAYLYAAGKGVSQDYKKAFKYYEKAAKQDLASAQYNVGLFYLHGIGVTPDEEKAKLWLQKSASHRFEPADILLRKLAVETAHAS